MGVMPGLQLCRVGSNGARRMYSTRGVLRVSRVLLNSFRTEIPREEEQSHRQADGRAEAEGVLRAHHAQDDYGNYPPQRRSSGIWGYLKVFIAGLGWVLFIGTLSRMSFMYSFLDFLDVAFPRKLHALYGKTSFFSLFEFIIMEILIVLSEVGQRPVNIDPSRSTN